MIHSSTDIPECVTREEVGGRDHAAIAIRRLFPEDHQPVGILVWQRPEEYRINNVEDVCIRANPNCVRKHGTVLKAGLRKIIRSP